MTLGTRVAVLHQGVLKQLDTPQRVYEHPANRFVAEFIGSPAINMLPARLVGTVEEMYLKGEQDGFSLRIPQERARVLAPYLGRRVDFAIRPEHIALRRNGMEANGNRVKARIDVVESLGSESIVHLVLNGQPLVARTEWLPELRPGHDAELLLNLDRMHLFDPVTEDAIC